MNLHRVIGAAIKKAVLTTIYEPRKAQHFLIKVFLWLFAFELSMTVVLVIISGIWVLIYGIP